MKTSIVVGICLAACSHPPNAAPSAAIVLPSRTGPSAPRAPTPSPTPVAAADSAPTAAAAAWLAEPLPLPGAEGAVSLDYLFYDREQSRIWVPAGGTGSVAVFDLAAHAFTVISGFKTEEREAHGKKRVLGPSAGAVGDGFAYIGNRATAEVCSVELNSLKTSSCLKLPSAIDGVAYVSKKREVWVTAPRTQSLIILDASKPASLRQFGTITVPGAPEGYAVDEPRGRFLTNLEDQGTTLTIDLETRRVKDTWHPGCSSDGPRGLAVDSSRRFALVACTDHVQVLDMAKGGALLGRLDAGEGVDNIDFNAQTGLVYVAAGQAARLTVARLDDRGQLTVVRTGETAPGARNAVADRNGNAFVADPQRGRLLLFRASPP